MIALSSLLTFVLASARWCGVIGVSYFVVTFAPSRTLEISFCCGKD
jgi:hypothetical protein